MGGAYYRDSGAIFNDAGAIWANHTTTLSGLIEAQSSSAANIVSTEKLVGSSSAQSSSAANLQWLQELAGLIEAQSGVSANLLQYYVNIPPFMQKDLIDPYSGGAWLWLVEIVIPTQVTQRIACNTEDVRYGGEDYLKGNFVPGSQKLSGDASIPRIILRVAQDEAHTLETIVNATKGGEGGTVKLIRTCEKYLEQPAAALQADYDILTAGSDYQWITFVLGMPDLLTQRFPLWLYSSKVCPLATPSLFKGPRCLYSGEDAVCTGLLEDCYAKGNAVHWGGEIGLDPAAVRI